MPRFFTEHCNELAPESIYRAKTRGRFEAGYQLSFVDVGLMPLVEQEIGEKLGQLVERAWGAARGCLAPGAMDSQLANWLLQSIFWLLAAKILRDKSVPGFEDIDLPEIEEILGRVANHYGAQERVLALGSRQRRNALLAASEIYNRFTSLSHVTPESLAAVYEAALVSEEARQRLGIHSTPSFLARYVVWRLAPWIEEIAPAERHVFEPTCGQGSFLVAAMRVLRDLLPKEVKRTDRMAYLRKHLHGLDVDSFAIELARLSLTLADIPNPDGWDLRCADVFTAPDFSTRVCESMILLANPPFESFSTTEREHLARRNVEVQPGTKSAELLRRSLPHLPAGAVFGVVVPQGLVHTRNAADIRSVLVQDFEIAEITLLPDKIFTYSGAESALLLGRKLRRAEKEGHQVHHLRVREHDAERFRASYRVSLERRLPQSRFAVAPEHSFAVPELEEVWQECLALPRLADFAEVAKGLEYLSGLPAGETFSATKFHGAARGFVRLSPSLRIDGQPREMWLSLEPEKIRRSGSGTETGKPQVLVNYAPVSRGPWRIKAILDPLGHAVTSRFLTIRPLTGDVPILFLWSLLNSPIANAYIFAHCTKRDNLKRVVASLPVPVLSSTRMQRVLSAASSYLRCVRAEGHELLAPAPDPTQARDVLLALDAEVLRLYDLPPRLERQVLDLFAGWPRLGVPFDFDRYFPAGFEPWIPLHMYLSAEFLRSNAGELRRHEGPAPDYLVEALVAAVEAFED